MSNGALQAALKCSEALQQLLQGSREQVGRATAQGGDLPGSLQAVADGSAARTRATQGRMCSEPEEKCGIGRKGWVVGGDSLGLRGSRRTPDARAHPAIGSAAPGQAHGPKAPTPGPGPARAVFLGLGAPP